MQLLRHNWHWKLLSLAIALMVAAYVRKQEDVRQQIRWLQVNVPLPPGQRLVEPPPGTTIQVSLEGRAEVVQAVGAEDLRLSFDTSRLEPGRRTLVPVTVELAERFRNRIDLDWRPRVLKVLTVSDATEEFAVAIKPLEPPSGWRFIEPPAASPPRVTVSGTQAAVDRVAAIVAPFRLEAQPQINALVMLQAVDRNNNLVRDVRIDPPQVLVTGLQERYVIQKSVPVQPVFEAPPGRPLHVEVNPPRVTLLGPERQVADVYVVETEPVALPPGETEVAREVVLRAPGPEIRLSRERVRVTLSLQPPGERAGGHAPSRGEGARRSSGAVPRTGGAPEGPRPPAEPSRSEMPAPQE